MPTERPPLVGEVIVNFFADRGCHVVSVTDPYGRILGFLDSAATFLSSSSSVVFTRLGGPRSRPTTFFSGGNRTRSSGSVSTRPQRRSLVYLRSVNIPKDRLLRGQTRYNSCKNFEMFSLGIMSTVVLRLILYVSKGWNSS
jgi:hypothetical protein